jgi:predicted enzyme related to lactoylglutathione lyase
MTHSPPIGSITWFDLTVPNADQVRDFYAAVVGWKWTPLPMGGYSDYCMNLPDSGDTVAGVCHARAVNSSMPAQWMLYINVANLEQSMARVLELGGKVIVPVRGYAGQGRFVVIQDPAGAVAALFEPATPDRAQTTNDAK